MTAAQAHADDADPAAWLSEALQSLPALDHMPSVQAQHAVGTLLDIILNMPSLCSPLSGPFTKTAHFVSTLLTSPLPYVQLAAYKALAGAVSVGPAALCSRSQGLLRERSLLSIVITQGLATEDSKALAAQLLQAVVGEGGPDEGRAPLAPWLLWLACYEQDPLVGATVSGIISLLHDYRYPSSAICQLGQGLGQVHTPQPPESRPSCCWRFHSAAGQPLQH